MMQYSDSFSLVPAVHPIRMAVSVQGSEPGTSGNDPVVDWSVRTELGLSEALYLQLPKPSVVQATSKFNIYTYMYTIYVHTYVYLYYTMNGFVQAAMRRVEGIGARLFWSCPTWRPRELIMYLASVLIKQVQFGQSKGFRV